MFVPYLFFLLFATLNHNSVLYANTPTPLNKEQIFKAAQEGDTQAFMDSMKNKENLNVKDQDGNTLFHVAAAAGHADIIELLAEYDTEGGFWSGVRRLFFGARRPDIDEQNNDGDTAVHYAVDDEELQALIMLTWHNAKLGVANKKKYTPVLVAAKKGKRESLYYLMGMCNNIDQQTIGGNTVIHMIIQNGHEAIVQELFDKLCLQEKEKKEYRYKALLDVPNDEGETPLIYYARTNNQKMGQQLASSGLVDLNRYDKKGNSSLDYTCLAHNYAYAEKLLSAGADINGQNPHGTPVVHKTIRAGDKKGTEWLFKNGALATLPDGKGLDALAIAVMDTGRKDMIRMCLDHGGDINRTYQHGRTLLMMNFAQGDNDMARYLMGLKANTNLIDNDGRNALHITALYNNSEGTTLLLDNNRLLLSTRDKFGNTPPFYATDKNEAAIKAMECFLKAGFPVNEQNNRGETVLHYASKAGNTKVISLLLDNNANVNVRTKENNTPALYACMDKQFESLFSVLSCDNINVVGSERKAVLHYALENQLSKQDIQNIIVNYRANIELCDGNGNSLLHYAIYYRGFDEMKFFMTSSLINHANNEGLMPLSCAIKQNKSIDTIAYLLSQGASVNRGDRKGWTDMHYAAAGGKVDIMKVLHNYGSLFTLTTNEGDNPLHIATDNNELNTIEYLLSKDKNLINGVNKKGENPFIRGVFKGHLGAVKLLLQEDDLIAGRVERVVEALKWRFDLSDGHRHVLSYLEPQLNAIKNECDEIVVMQNVLKELLERNRLNNNVLRQQTSSKEYAQFAHPYQQTTPLPMYAEKDLKRTSRDWRNNHKQAMKCAIEKEQQEDKLLSQQINKVAEEKSRLRRALEEEEKRKREEISALPQGAELIECNLCCEEYADVKRRCTTANCTYLMCGGCIATYKNGGKNICPQCQQPLQ